MGHGRVGCILLCKVRTYFWLWREIEHSTMISTSDKGIVEYFFNQFSAQSCQKWFCWQAVIRYLIHGVANKFSMFRDSFADHYFWSNKTCLFLSGITQATKIYIFFVLEMVFRLIYARFGARSDSDAETGLERLFPILL